MFHENNSILKAVPFSGTAFKLFLLNYSVVKGSKAIFLALFTASVSCL